MSLTTTETTKMSRQTGFTLIEILVTVIVLSIGLLGLAGLQAASLRFNSTAYQRSQATTLAYDIVDRMRANTIVARSGAYNGAVTPAGTTLVAIDLGQWRTELSNSLPASTGTISQPNGNVFTINIQWDDSRGQEPPQQFIMTTEL